MAISSFNLEYPSSETIREPDLPGNKGPETAVVPSASHTPHHSHCGNTGEVWAVNSALPWLTVQMVSQRPWRIQQISQAKSESQKVLRARVLSGHLLLPVATPM